MTHEEIQSAYRTYRDSRGTLAEGDAADAFVAAVLSYEDNLPRALLDLAFWVACEAKKAEKPRNSEDGTEVGRPARFVHFARKVIALRGKIRRLPEGERRLTGAEVRAYAWAVYAVATKGDDEEEVRASAELFERIYSFRTAHGWVPDEKDKQALERVRARIVANWAKVQEARVKAESGDVVGSVQCYHEAMQTGVLSGSDARGYGWAMVKRVWRQDVQERELRFLMGDLLRLSQDALPLESENARKIRHGFLIGVSKRIHELEKRGHKFCRYADDSNIYVKSEEAAKRVLESVTKFLEGGLKLRVNRDKSGTFRSYESVFLGYTFHRYVQTRVIVAPKSVKRLKEKLKVIYRRSRGTSLSNAIEKLTQLLRGGGTTSA